MKKLLLFIITICLTKVVLSQNVGIGTAVPSAKLHINHKATASSPTLRLFDSTAGTGSSILFAKESQSNTFSIISTNSTFAADNMLDFRTTFNSGFLLRGNGRVGINNVTNPTATLHVGGGVKINDTLNVTGDVNFTGKLKLNNNTGNAGQVLISNGVAGNPEWANSSYPSNERAWVRTIATNITTAPFQDTIDISSIDYNTSTATINLTNNTITINKAGLYRFQGVVDLDISDAVTNVGFQSYPRCLIVVNDDDLFFYVGDESVYDEGNFHGRSIPFSVDRYVTAGSVICLTFSMRNLSSASNLSIGGNQSTYFSFYLIAE